MKMNKITVNASTKYDILIGDGISFDSGRLTSDCLGHTCKAAIITDDIVDKLYSERVISSFESAGFKTIKFVFKNGESSKNINTLDNILEFLSKNEFSRSDIVAALGGGVVGDVAGFAAAVYMRGIKYIQIPTTLLAAVDSSVGGKTAIDLTTGKNQAGAFHQPSLVICDTKIQENLPEDIFSCGSAEAIKCGILADKKLFEIFETENPLDNVPEIIERSIKIKASLVEKDEFDNGERQFLNLGHTFGHCIEKLSNYEILHGQAVSAGTVLAAKASVAKGYTDENTLSRIIMTLKRNNLMTDCNFGKEDLLKTTAVDKKIRDNIITFVMIDEIGKCSLSEINIEELGELL